MKRPALLVPSTLFLIVLVAMAGISAPAGAQVVSDSADAVAWKLDFEVEKFGSVNVPDKLGRSETVWYLAYKLTNNTSNDVPLSLHFRLETDTKKVYRESVHKKAQKLIDARLKHETKAASQHPETLGAGESMHGVAIFGKLDPELDKIDITITGLEDVVYRVGAKRFYRKNGLLLQWARPGDEYFTYRDPVKFVKRSWKTLEGPREIR